MDNSEQERTTKMNLYERYSNYTDDQILEILRKHKDYQEVAVDVAVKIAVERHLINSEQDLLAPEFQNYKTSGFTFFPEISSEFHRKRLVGSIFRFLYLLSLLPLTYGILNYAKGEIDQTLLGVGIGLIWFSLSIFLSKTRKFFIFIPLFILLFAVSVITGYGIFKKEDFQFMDMIILVVGTLLPLYLLLYLKKLIHES
ncbi:MAG: hypothetical protein Q8S54_16660 [Bacteroidota bacterium]|nr:hypothetical protein [Odoribacter sp.]MDP3644802.1 hypothetical protein [Bacteroidota bacterium]